MIALAISESTLKTLAAIEHGPEETLSALTEQINLLTTARQALENMLNPDPAKCASCKEIICPNHPSHAKPPAESPAEDHDGLG
ncbi:MAG: hypothetical protein ACOYUZ_04010 [Patescibacteria group bacterium]